MDVLSDVLRVIRLSGAVFLTAEFSAPWSLASPPAHCLAPVLMPTAECFTIFHILAEGNCWVELKGQAPVHFQAGDVILFPSGDPHLMCDKPGVPPTPVEQILSVSRGSTTRLSHGGGGGVSRFVCGYLACDQRFDPLFGSLPPLLHVRSRPQEAAVTPVGAASREAAGMPPDAATWLETTLRYVIALAHSTDSGDSPLLARLTELLFVELLRRYMQQSPGGQTGWLAALNDPQVGKALALLHARPAHAWTVEELAREVGVSRSALAERFTSLLGEAPMRYLAGWRMHLAKQMLSEGALSISSVALRTGYESEAAFNRAFKRHVGEPPAGWRKRVQEKSVTESNGKGSPATAKSAPA